MKVKVKLKFYTLVAGGLVWFERGVEARSGHGVRAIARTSDASRPERSFATLGQNERPRENKPRQDPQQRVIYQNSCSCSSFLYLIPKCS